MKFLSMKTSIILAGVTLILCIGQANADISPRSSHAYVASETSLVGVSNKRVIALETRSKSFSDRRCRRHINVTCK